MKRSIWDAFAQSYQWKQTKDMQESQFNQEMALREAASRLQERSFTREGEWHQGEVDWRTKTRKEDILQRGIENKNAAGYLNIAGRNTSLGEQRWEMEKPLLEMGLEEAKYQTGVRKTEREIMKEALTAPPEVIYGKSVATGNFQLLQNLLPIIKQRASMEISQKSKLGKFATPTLFGGTAGEKYLESDYPVAKFVDQAIKPWTFGLWGSKYTYEETDKRARSLGGFLGSLNQFGNSISTSPEQTDLSLDQLEQLYFQQQGQTEGAR